MTIKVTMWNLRQVDPSLLAEHYRTRKPDEAWERQRVVELTDAHLLPRKTVVALKALEEADVYIRERGTDVRHNAIVGVMLRVVEYYAGLLFMTTNLDGIDDAIKSRATAHMVYAIPGAAKLADIWRVLGAQFGLSLSSLDCLNLAAKWPRAVGRDVKNLCKLARLARHADGGAAGAEDVLRIAKFLDMAKKEAAK